MSLFHASTCFGHTCSSSGGQNCTIQLQCDDTRGCIVQFWPPDDEHVCSKHVEAWNKLIIKFSAPSFFNIKINSIANLMVYLAKEKPDQPEFGS